MGRFLTSVAAIWLTSALALADESTWHSDPKLSIGLSTPISPDGWNIPNFTVLGITQVLRDRVIMTPPAPGSQRSSIWSEHTNPYNEWSAEIAFRATGEDKSGGSFHFWYTVGGVGYAGTDSVYTARPWDGLAILVDKYGAYGGSIRGFLNDGKTDYSIHHNVASLAFGHCDFNYRNLGSPSKLKVTHSYQGLKVEADGRICFETKDVRLPAGSYFGISAASADSPDSFEIFSFTITTPETAHPSINQQQQGKEGQQVHETVDQQQQPIDHNHADYQQATHDTISGQKRAQDPDMKGKLPHEVAFEPFKQAVEDKPASQYKTQEEQFKDLHDRLTALTHHLASLQEQIGQVYDNVIQANGRLDDFRSESRHRWVPREQIDRMEGRQNTVENMIRDLEKTFHSKDWSQYFDSIHTALRDQHSNLLFSVPDSVANAVKAQKTWWESWGRMLEVVAVVGALGWYVMYKKKKAAGHKKYL